MRCPACERELKEVKVANIAVDICSNGCGGIWFDNFEFQKVDEQHEAAGESLLDIPRDPNIKVDHSKIRTCPRCNNIKMLKHFSSIKFKVEIDECPNCGGIWLDCGELGEIRKEFANEKEKQIATEKYFAKLFDAEIEKMKVEKMKKIATLISFICPGYGKLKK